MDRIKELEKENQELKSKLEKYTNDPTAKFYVILCEAMDKLGAQIKNGTLNLKEDTFYDSLVYVMEKSDKMFAGLAKGREYFEEVPKEEQGSKKGEKSNTVAFRQPIVK
jgi:hypothetical protein